MSFGELFAVNSVDKDTVSGLFYLDMTPILGGEKDKLEFDCKISPDACKALGRLDFPDVAFPGDFHLFGTVVSFEGYMEADITFSLPYVAECARCLEKCEDVFTVHIRKPVADTKGKNKIIDEDTDDYLLIRDSKLPLGDIAVLEAELDFPTKHLCKEDCKGLCPKCGKNLNLGDCDCRKKDIDPRLEKLKAMKAMFSED